MTAEALAIVEDTRSGLAQENHRLAFGSRTQSLFDLRIDLQWQMGEVEAALETAEMARARALLDRLRQIDAKIGSTADEALLDEARRLRVELREKEAQRRRSEYRGGFSVEERSEQKVAIVNLVARLNEVVAEIGRQHPEYFRLMRAQPASVGAVQALLDSTAALLVYRLGEQRSYLWLVTEATVQGFELPPRSVIESEAHRSRDRLASGTGSGGSKAWSPRGLEALVDRILPKEVRPALAARQRWMVVADGVLELLPFAALPDPAAGPPARPLLDRYVIVRLPSATAWVELESRPEIQAPAGLLALVADPAYTSFPSLPGSKLEAEAIHANLPEGAKATVLLGHEATREALLSGILRGHRMIHLSVHGEIHPGQPALSFLAFAQRDAQGQPLDGQLFAHELYGLDLPAELVVLAGCETGLGPLIPGEGLLSGLSRSFLYAGARRVMVSLWRVPDRETHELMTLFYNSLYAEVDPATALREAQRRLYLSGAPPHDWAGFVLVGG